MTAEDCRHCKEPIEFVNASWQVDRGTYRDPNGYKREYFHVDGEHRCATPEFNLAAPVPRCPGCGSTNYVHDATDPWADYWRCGDCTYTYRMSLGD